MSTPRGARVSFLLLALALRLVVVYVAESVTRGDFDQLAGLCRDGDTEALRLAERRCAQLVKPVLIDEVDLVVSASIGIVIARGEDRSPCCARPTSRCTPPRRAAPGRTPCSTTPCTPRWSRGTSWSWGLEVAVGCGELFLEYQPVLHLARHEMVSVEALLRWQHPVHRRCRGSSRRSGPAAPGRGAPGAARSRRTARRPGPR